MNNRLSDIRKKLIISSLDALLISSVTHIIYLTGFSSFSLNEREAMLLITKGQQYLYTDGRYTEAVRREIPDFTLIEITSSTPLKTAIHDTAKKHALTSIGFEETNLTVAEYTNFSKALGQIKLIPAKGIVEKIRIIKTQNEITAIKKACKLGDTAFSHVLWRIKNGMTEKDIACSIEIFIKKQGAELSFPPIVAFGKNSSIPHHQTSNTKLKKNEFVLLDFGVKLKNYCSDMTRTVVFGKATDEQKKMYETVLAAQQKAIDFLNNGTMKQFNTKIKASDVDKAARNFITSQNYPTIPHSLGHGIGLEVHEAPRLSPNSKELLKEGMVFSIEPGIYIPGFGGIRIEDLVVIENNKVRLLTKSPKNLIEL